MICNLASILLVLASIITLLTTATSAGHIVQLVEGVILFTSNGTLATRALSHVANHGPRRSPDKLVAREDPVPAKPKPSASPVDYCCPARDDAPDSKYEPDTFYNTESTSFPECGYAPTTTDATETWCYYDTDGVLQRDLDDGWCSIKANTCLVEQKKKRDVAAELMARARPAGKLDRSVEPEVLTQMRSVWRAKSRIPSSTH